MQDDNPNRLTVEQRLWREAKFINDLMKDFDPEDFAKIIVQDLGLNIDYNENQDIVPKVE